MPDSGKWLDGCGFESGPLFRVSLSGYRAKSGLLRQFVMRSEMIDGMKLCYANPAGSRETVRVSISLLFRTGPAGRAARIQDEECIK